MEINCVTSKTFFIPHSAYQLHLFWADFNALPPTKQWNPILMFSGIQQSLLNVFTDIVLFNTLRPRQNYCQFADDSFKCIFDEYISIEISQ